MTMLSSTMRSSKARRDARIPLLEKLAEGRICRDAPSVEDAGFGQQECAGAG
jgi:hypothetical protein